MMFPDRFHLFGGDFLKKNLNLGFLVVFFKESEFSEEIPIDLKKKIRMRGRRSQDWCQNWGQRH